MPTLRRRRSTTFAEQLPELIAEGHSAPVFSQFTIFGVVRQRLDEMGIAYAYLDGSMTAKARSAAIAEFTEGGVHVFLISLKAGGFGPNLTEADYCFVCDPGGTRPPRRKPSTAPTGSGDASGDRVPVGVRGTIEEKVVALQDRKRELFNAVVDDGDLFGAGITEGDIRELLGG